MTFIYKTQNPRRRGTPNECYENKKIFIHEKGFPYLMSSLKKPGPSVDSFCKNKNDVDRSRELLNQ